MGASNTMKNILTATAVTTAVILGVAGCANETTPSSTQSGGGDEKYSVTLALAVQAGCPFCIAIQKGAEAKAEELGVDLTTVSPKTPDTASQIQQLNGILASPPDALVLQPFDATALVAPVKQFTQAGVPTIAVDGGLVDQEALLSLITSDNVAGGALAANALAEQLGNRGKVAYFGYTPGFSSNDDRERGFVDEIETMDDMEFLGSRYNGDDQTAVAGQVAALLASDPDVAGIFAGTEASAIGVATALKEAGKSGEVTVVAFDGAPDEVAALNDGTLTELIVQKAFEMGELAIQQAVDYLNDGTEPEAVTHTEYVRATKENVTDSDVAIYLYPAQ